MPFEGKKTHGGEQHVPKLTVNNFYHQNLASIIKGVLEDHVFTNYNTTPFQQCWRTSDGRDIRVYSEIYSSDSVLDMYREVNTAPCPPGDDYEGFVVLLMLFSDATLLSNFGQAFLWPIYLFVGNQSKYTRGKPTAKACHHLAYIPSLPDGWQSNYAEIYGKAPTREVHTHLKCKIVHGVWRLILQDEEFCCAYTEGIIAKCGDDIIRRVLLRIVTYTGDYPEKIILSTLKYFAKYPCPRCLVPKHLLSKMGTMTDMQQHLKIRLDSKKHQACVRTARGKIFKKGCLVNSKQVNDMLGKHSYVPTTNAFSEFLLDKKVNFFKLFVPDFLHKYELSVWKSIFIHLVRMLLSIGGTVVTRVDEQ
ncbi:hypothetical protein CONPUDRAFT_58000 [Coniophora puteana RWD-64-598 SS2]|uniref:Uncharacterized protein n=1 Tax=Coniophora puteana (strain RWD-64-598) TaxID=741705 RepID=A0A5M3MLX1_CONPW|nr:uncharacterized protein CONPUDRAFT_58000 [Coniophora puteana RWD-64-598 SS2]EIW80113.1 hypothetical protein CONPUDRAFT_58000 [Coniophora puteana RWD-64-598 SS2]